jgi:hypothetical protein
MYARCLGFLIIEAPDNAARDYISHETVESQCRFRLLQLDLFLFWHEEVLSSTSCLITLTFTKGLASDYFLFFMQQGELPSSYLHPATSIKYFFK